MANPQYSDWSSDPVSTTYGNRSSTERIVWTDDDDNDRVDQKKSSFAWYWCFKCCIVGSLVAGIGLAIVLTFWLTSKTTATETLTIVTTTTTTTATVTSAYFDFYITEFYDIYLQRLPQRLRLALQVLLRLHQHRLVVHRQLHQLAVQAVQVQHHRQVIGVKIINFLYFEISVYLGTSTSSSTSSTTSTISTTSTTSTSTSTSSTSSTSTTTSSSASTTSVTTSTSTTTTTQNPIVNSIDKNNITNNTWTLFTCSYLAAISDNLTLQFTLDVGHKGDWYLDDISVKDPTSVEMLINGDLEASPALIGWSTGSGGAISTAESHSSSHSFDVPTTSAWIAQSFAAIGGQVYTVTFWLYLNPSPGGSGGEPSVVVTMN
ncbi:unnamed protein product [Adineta steineri]|uniref:Uncharacterized protein n=1 Tax=Adineta steineri TaxID=433720 RepID=A0A813SL18_9BILA|nr:unnamed protein product [Adineta steineri]CAF4041811.1 unnamed protein product [Adineta steineri]